MLRVGTDYSGMESPLVALQTMRVRFRHEFASDVDAGARRVIEERFRPRRLFHDVLKRSPRALPAGLDLYVAGFPCQAFSSINSLTGHHALPRAPLRHFDQCLKVVATCRPKAFVLENVPRLLSVHGGRTFKALRARLVGACARHYHLSTHVLDSKDFGLPQHRRRLYIVGLRKTVADGPMPPPRPRALRTTFADLVEKGAARRPITPAAQRRFDACARQFRRPVFIPPVLSSMLCTGTTDVPGCLTRAGGGVYWSKRRLLSTVREELRLQGFPDSFVFPEGVSDRKARELIGNSMSVNVLRAIFRQIFRSCRGLGRPKGPRSRT